MADTFGGRKMPAKTGGRLSLSHQTLGGVRNANNNNISSDRVDKRSSIMSNYRRKSIGGMSSLTIQDSGISKKLDTILNYGPEFEELIRCEVGRLKAGKEVTSQQQERSGSDVIVCARVSEKSSGEIMDNYFQATFARNPFLYAMNTSLDFRNNPRLDVQKFLFDTTWDEKTAGKHFDTVCLLPFLAQAKSGVICNFISAGKTTRSNSESWEKWAKIAIQDLLKTCRPDWKLYLSCYEIVGNQTRDLLSISGFSSDESSVIGGGSKRSSPIRRRVSTSSATSFSCGSSSGTSASGSFKGSCTSLEKGSKPTKICRQKKVLLESEDQVNHLVTQLLRFRQEASHLVLKIHLQHQTMRCLSDGWVNLVDLVSLYPPHHNSPDIRNSYMVLKQCIKGRIKLSQNPQLHQAIPFQASGLTSAMEETFQADSRDQVRFLVLGNLGPTVADTDTNLDLIKFCQSLKPAMKRVSTTGITQVVIDPNNVAEWEAKETQQWIQLNSDIPVERIPKVTGRQLLGLTQLQFVELFRKSFPHLQSKTALDLQVKLWEEVSQLRRKDADRSAAKSSRGFSQRKSSWRDQTLSEEDKVITALGSSKRTFEAKLNKGFEDNIPRFEKRTKDMMKLEWIGKVKAADRAEAKLYPILNIDTKQILNRRRNSTIQ